jgi:hypothetical protein
MQKDKPYQLIIDYSDESYLLGESAPKCSREEFHEFLDQNPWIIHDIDLTKPICFFIKRLDESFCVYNYEPPFRVIIDCSDEIYLPEELDARLIPECSLEDHKEHCFGNDDFLHFCSHSSLPPPGKVLIRKRDRNYCWCICGGPRDQISL